MEYNTKYFEKVNIEKEDLIIKQGIDKVLLKYINLIPKGKVLDLGVGSGRNSLALAKMGYEVEGVDVSAKAIEMFSQLAEEANVNVKAINADISNFAMLEKQYSLIILSNILHFFKTEDIDNILKKVDMALVNNGIVYIRAISAEQSRAKNEEFIEVGNNTYYYKNANIYIHQFTREEINSYFPHYRVICYNENISLDVNNQEYYNGNILYIAQNNCN